jgi:hypothetical protein
MRKIHEYVQALYKDLDPAPCPFTDKEIEELERNGELLVYLPKGLSMSDLCERWGIKANVDFSNEKMIRNAMTNVDHWFVTSADKTPELLYRSGQIARRTYEDEGLHGMDVRRYLAFCATFKWKFDSWPDQSYWTFLLSGSYDRSGVSVIGFDEHGILNHHGWMRNFKAKFAGSRYVVLAPRIEITRETADLPRAYRGKRGMAGLEAGMDD